MREQSKNIAFSFVRKFRPIHLRDPFARSIISLYEIDPVRDRWIVPRAIIAAVEGGRGR